MPIIVLSGIGLLMAGVLAVGRKIFDFDVDERRERLMAILPGANCGGCGYPGCAGYAAALVEGKAAATLCPPGGDDLATDIGRILGVEVPAVEKKVALVACAGDTRYAKERSHYIGIADCDAAQAVAGGSKACQYGCLGLGSCVRACPFDAIAVSKEGVAYVNEAACTGCGSCVAACPRDLISLVPTDADVHVLCMNPEKPKAVKAVCAVGCTACKLCGRHSPSIGIEGGVARVRYEGIDDIPQETALVCPQGSIFDRRESSLEAWLTDPAAREAHEKRSAELKKKERGEKAALRTVKGTEKRSIATKQLKT